ncbi:hypothetical protein [Pseudoalteromonas sp. S16_S37]|uniref:hypothetical protein n=1 Tax=Pseudoalteromonas sp. S16_S37 TaxID=2720228 RepID=UPI0016806892|nr:hypothetical protein [Pseudoalteromonas sp. S16_S37]MBD1584687.1 hypothetical protein [Pseudoalteromonas sp. S16_S37]
MISIKLKNVFYVLCVLTIFCPITIAFTQAYFVNHELSFDLTVSGNWVHALDTFALPVEVFKILVTITSVLGLYYKISQTERQISQAVLRDTFAMYIEHRKYVLEILDENLGTLVNEAILHIKRPKFYISMFPENMPTKMKNYADTSELMPIKFDFFCCTLREICNHVETQKKAVSKELVECWVSRIEEDFYLFGFSFNPIDFSSSELVKIIEIAEKLIPSINYFCSVDSTPVKSQLKYFRELIKDDLLTPYNEQVF